METLVTFAQIVGLVETENSRLGEGICLYQSNVMMKLTVNA